MRKKEEVARSEGKKNNKGKLCLRNARMKLNSLYMNKIKKQKKEKETKQNERDR